MNETFNTAPIDGGWSKYEDNFTSCTATCGGGVKLKYRYCNNPVPQYGGRDCSGPSFIAKICNVVPCNYAPAVQDLCQKLNKVLPYSAKGQWHMDQNDPQRMGDEGCKYVCKTNNSDKPNYAVKLPYPDGRTCTHMNLNPLSRYYWGERKSTCSRSCGGGLRPHNITCMDGFMFNIKAEDYLCDIRTKPNEEPTPCNEHPCPYRWSTGNWSECSITCGHGLKTRDINCLQFQDGVHYVVPDILCASERRPDNQMSCDLGRCWKWHIKHESSCSKTCSEGFKNRTIICVEADTLLELSIDQCDEEKKPSDI
ncbi:ATS20-like protein, partial [Mya arenaria]